MALDTYSALQSAVASWLHRDDLASVIPDFIRLAEDAMSRDLADLPVMWAVSGAITLSAGQNTVSLPADALGIVYCNLISPTHASVESVPIASLARSTGLDSSVTGQPRAVAFRGAGGAAGTPSALVYPAADVEYQVEFCYRAAVPALSEINLSNFVLARAPSIYLYGSLIASAPYIGQDARLTLWESKYRQAVESFRSQDWDGPMLLGTEVADLFGSSFDITTG